jgi:hypothetical protein
MEVADGPSTVRAALEGHRSMNRIAFRGVGFAAGAIAATSLAWSAPAPTGRPPMTNPVTTLSAAVLVTAHMPAVDGTSAEMARLHDARLRTEHAGDIASAAAAHANHVAQLAKTRAANAERVSRLSVRYVAPGSVRATGQMMAAARGWTGVQFSCLDDVWTRESHWRVTAYNPNSGAYGIPQAQPGSKMASAGPGWRTDAATQIAWGLAYIARTYGSPCAAWSFWQNHLWY